METITDKDYPPVQEMKVVKHKLYPISYIESDGSQRDTIWNFKPCNEWVGESFVVETLHPKHMSKEVIEGMIEAAESELNRLKEMME